MKGNKPHFHEAYYRARKAYALFSGISLLYVAVGIKIGTRPFSEYDIELLSPNAIPPILIALVTYYGIRYSIEWLQASKERRKLVVSKVDFALSHMLSISAILMYSYQELSDIQFFNSQSVLKTFAFSISKLFVIEFIWLIIYQIDLHTYLVLKRIKLSRFRIGSIITLLLMSIASYYIFGNDYSLDLGSFILFELFMNFILFSSLDFLQTLILSVKD